MPGFCHIVWAFEGLASLEASTDVADTLPCSRSCVPKSARTMDARRGSYGNASRKAGCWKSARPCELMVAGGGTLYNWLF